ncbi:MAG: hypothetical protein J7K87_03310 [Candidatus Aenigmarchaeota archaeon]|nr:hypothetical protein [Candidatus Aenigmarchaeota archaeon]
MERVISNKGFGINTIVCIFAFILLVFALAFSIGFFAGILKQEEEGADIVTQEIVQMSMLSRILTSKDCFSTGEMGILNKTLLDERKQTGDIDCVKMYRTYFDLTISSSNDKWDFSYDLTNEPKQSMILPFLWLFGKKPGIQITLPVLIRSDGGDEPAILKLKTYYKLPPKGSTSLPPI